MTGTSDSYFRKGFGLKREVQDDLAADYDGRLVDLLREHDYTLEPAASRCGWRRSSASATASSARSSTRTRRAGSFPTGASSWSARSSTIRT